MERQFLAAAASSEEICTIELCCIEVVTRWLKLEDELFRQATIVPVREERMSLVPVPHGGSSSVLQPPPTPVHLKPLHQHQQEQQQQHSFLASSTTTTPSSSAQSSVDQFEKTQEEEGQTEQKLLPYICPYVDCKKAYQKATQLDYHMRNNLDHNRPLLQPFYCTFPGEKSCKFVEANKATVLGHIAIAHFGVPPEQLANLTEAERRRDEAFLGFRVNTLKRELEEAELSARAERHQSELARQQRNLLLLQTEGPSSSSDSKNFGYESLANIYWSSTSKKEQAELTERLSRGLKSKVSQMSRSRTE